MADGHEKSQPLASFPDPTQTLATPAGVTALPETITLSYSTAAKPNTLRIGELIAGRFEISGSLGAGGMAFVYDAFDRKLKERRALKFARPGHLQTIPEETRTALRITHENICRTYEIHTAETSIGPADFISMELIEGETLLVGLQHGAWPQPWILDAAKQLCLGLQAAHAAGIVHQDLKSNNVMLSHRPDGSLRVVIMDFGLACWLGCGLDHHAGGTPNYMAPERFSGAPPNPAGDVYALGVILYELLTGALPFPAGAPLSQRASMPEPPSRSERRPDAGWDAIVLRCLKPDPRRRLQSASGVLRAIERAFEGHTRRRLLVAAALTAAGALPVVALRQRIWPPLRAHLAVLPLQGSSGDAMVDRAAKGALFDLGKRLESVASASRRLILIPLEDTVRYAVDSSASAASSLGATHVLSVKLEPRAAGFGVEAYVQDCRGGFVLHQFQGDFQAGDLAALPAALIGVVTSAFHLPHTAPLKILPAAYQPYAAGLSSLRSAPPNLDRALSFFDQALQIDSTAVPALTGSAEAYLERYRVQRDPGSLNRAGIFAARAQSLQPDSPAVLSALALVERYQGRPERAIELLRRTTELEPDNCDAWRRIGIVLREIGRNEEAVEALRRAVELAPSYYAPHRDLGAVYFLIGRTGGAIEEFRTVTRLAPGFAEGFSYLGAALVTAEDYPAAETALHEAVRLLPSRTSLNNLAVLLRIQGRNREAVSTLQQSVQAGVEDATVRLNLGNALLSVGRKPEARAEFERARDLARDALRRNPRDAPERARLAYSMAMLDGASWAADEALQAAQLAPSDYSVIFWTAMTLEAAGRRSDVFPLLAGVTYDRLRSLRRQPDLAGLAKDPRFVSLLQKARESDSKLQGKEHVHAN